MAPRAKKVKLSPTLELPGSRPSVARWVVLGLDPSLSRVGLATMLVDESPWWFQVGSIKPKDSSEQSWIRSKGMGMYLAQVLSDPEIVKFTQEAPTGLLLSYEAPTPGNDYLAVVSKTLRSTLYSDSLAVDPFVEKWELMTNASTMRSLLGLVQRGSGNKKENQEKAWTFLPQKEFPGLDTDACDATLFTVLGVWTSRLFREGIEAADVPGNFKERFCDMTSQVKGKGKNAYTLPRGVLHNPEYWFEYKFSDREFLVKDARIPPRKQLQSVTFTI